MVQNQIYVITGGPGFGKTALIDELRKSEYFCSGEFARELIEEQKILAGEILPWKNPKLFQETVLMKRIAFYESVPENILAFADRGIPDQLAFAQYKGFGVPLVLTQSAAKYRYADQVFITPPWKEIYTNDNIRTESFEEATLIHQAIFKIYSDLNYQVIELPLLPNVERMNFILQTILKNKSHEH